MPQLNDILYQECITKQEHALSEVTYAVNAVANHLYSRTGIERGYPFALAYTMQLPKEYWEEKVFVALLGNELKAATSYTREPEVLACIGQCGEENDGYMLMFTDCLFDQRQAAVVRGAYTEFFHPDYFTRAVLGYSFGFSVKQTELRSRTITTTQASGIPAFLCEECYEALLDFPGSGLLVEEVEKAEELFGERKNTVLELTEWWYPQLPQRATLERLSVFSQRAANSLKETNSRMQHSYSLYLREGHIDKFKRDVITELEASTGRVRAGLRSEMVAEFSSNLFDNRPCLIKMDWDAEEEEYARGEYHKTHGVGVATPSELKIRGRRWLYR